MTGVLYLKPPFECTGKDTYHQFQHLKKMPFATTVRDPYESQTITVSVNSINQCRVICEARSTFYDAATFGKVRFARGQHQIQYTH